ncbi:hypothetical protein JT359_16160 [Candidatus Poribacteria bacterium]|nr:hypothetical protein [Candidatus Poribacteria bacterium]
MYYPTKALGIYPETHHLSYALVTYKIVNYVCEETYTLDSYSWPEATIAERLNLLADGLIKYRVDAREIAVIGVTSPFHPEPDALRLEGVVLNGLYDSSDFKYKQLFHLDPHKLHTPIGYQYKYAKNLHNHIQQSVQFPEHECKISISQAIAVAAAVTAFKICDDPPIGNSTYNNW